VFICVISEINWLTDFASSQKNNQALRVPRLNGMQRRPFRILLFFLLFAQKKETKKGQPKTITPLFFGKPARMSGHLICGSHHFIEPMERTSCVVLFEVPAGAVFFVWIFKQLAFQNRRKRRRW
jgi:hypothetical protein